MTSKMDKALGDYGNTVVQRVAELNAGKRFHDKQVELFNAVFRDGYKRIFVFKGRKAGGTESLLYTTARVMGTVPNASCYIIGPTQTGQCETVWDNRKIHSYMPREWGPTPHEQQKRIRLAVNDSFVKIEGGDDPDRCRNLNEGDLFCWDEAKDHKALSLEFCYPNVFPRNGIWIINGTPPTSKSNHYFKKYQEIQNDPEWKIVRMTAWDNPFFPGGHKELERLKKSYYDRGEGWIWEVEWEGRFVFDGGRKVLPKFDDKNKAPRAVLMDMLRRDANHLKWVCCIDPGYSSVFAVLFAAYNPYTAQIFFLDEIYSTERSQNAAREMWPHIKQKQQELFQGRWDTLYDSAATSFAVEVNSIERAQGNRTFLIPTKKKPQDEENYFRTWNSACVEYGQFFVASDACPKTIWEMENYELEEVKGGLSQGDLRYPDQNNHNLDNGRYILKYLNYTGTLKQETTRTENLRDVETLGDRIKRRSKEHDFVGFGGEDADFGITDLLH